MRKIPEVAFSEPEFGALPLRCNPGGCKPEKTGKSAKNGKPGNAGKSTLPGVEVAGFEPAAFWSRTKRATKLRYTSTLEPMRGLEPLTC